MTVEIREIVIRATVSGPVDGTQLEAVLADLKKEITEECLAAVQEKLDREAYR